MSKHYILRPFLTILIAMTAGCASTPAARETNFLSDYSKLRHVDDTRMSYVSPELRSYRSFIVEPVQFRIPPEKLSEAERIDVANHFRSRLVEVLEKRGLTATGTAGPGVARMRIALTDIARSTWWKKLHPVSKMAGAGTGGAAMEAEVVDSVDGKQLGAAVRSSTGNQFDITAFSTAADVKSAIDKWAEQAGKTLDELRSAPVGG